MKNIIYAVVWLLFSHSIVYCQNDEGIVLINSITNKDIGNNIGATIKFEISKVNCKIRDYEGLKHTPDVINCEVEVNRYDTANRIKSMPYCPNYSDSPSRYTTRIIITVNAIGFETYTEELSYSWEGERPSILRKKIFLIPKGNC